MLHNSTNTTTHQKVQHFDEVKNYTILDNATAA